MKASELRIGNLAQKNKKVKPLSVADIAMVEIRGMKGVYEPIPLTEEWLKRFGFEKVVNGLFAIDLFHYNLKEYRLYISKNESNEVDFVEIKHVHSLQNLYFALTGEELNQNKEDGSSN